MSSSKEEQEISFEFGGADNSLLGQQPLALSQSMGKQRRSAA
jgi:hypothetical protein